MKASKSRPSLYYSITNGGQLIAHTVRFDAASNLRNRHRLVYSVVVLSSDCVVIFN